MYGFGEGALVKVTEATGGTVMGVIYTLGLVIFKGVNFYTQGGSATIKTQLKPASMLDKLLKSAEVVAGL